MTIARENPVTARRAPVEPPRTPDTIPGSVAAVLLAAGIGAVVLGLTVVVDEASAAARSMLGLGTAAGPLTGEALAGSVAFLASWAGLRAALGRRSVAARPAVRVTVLLVALALLLTFPPVYGLFHR